jgi:F0F1-type ATP synthase assembly protein I
MKILNALRMVTFIVTLGTTIPLFVNYLAGTAPKHAMITHLHVWFGLAFFIIAIISMLLMKKNSGMLNKSDK